jgi:LuxR family transcriptional regulator, maltose regulon positive regulatory protein
MLNDARARRAPRLIRGEECPEEAVPAPVFTHDDMPAAAKFVPPPARPDWVERPDLIDRLDQAASRLVLLVAPAGYGKTTLLAQWYAQPAESRSFAWISLDEDDNAPAALWRLVVSALAQAIPAPGLKYLARSLPGQSSAVSRLLLPGLIRELSALDRRVTIVLDGYDALTDRECHEQLGFLLDRLPPHVQVALSTRSRPPFALARMRAHGDITLIGPVGLRMTSQDAARLIQGLCGADLSQRDADGLAQRTEGWPAGMYLMALSWCAAIDRWDFLRSPTGGSQYVTDYLTEEVINRQPEHIRQFLLRTSFLERFNAPLCEAVTGSADAGEIIATMESESLFLVPLGDRREWFRYHHLFADALFHMLIQADPGAVSALRRRASTWHRRHGEPRAAINYALVADDAEVAVAVIAERWHRYVDSGRIAIVQAWLAKLGADQIKASPLAAHCAAWISALSGDRRAFMRWLAVVEAGGSAGPLPDGMRSLEFSAALLRGTFGFGGIGPMVKSAARAIELDPDLQADWRPLAMAASGTALYFAGEIAVARQRLEQAMWVPSPLARVRLLAATMRCLVALEEGRLDQATEFARTARELEANLTYGLATAPQAAFAGLATGAVAAAEDRLEEAKEELSRALATRRRRVGLSPWPKFEILLRLAPVVHDLGDPPAAAALLTEARDVPTLFPEGARAQLDRLEGLERHLGGYGQEISDEHLTPRERAVLRQLEGALSLSGIGKEMYVSANTVKTHTRAIYRKLGVSSRQDAIARAGALGLL